MTIVQKQRWYTKIILKINPDYQATFIALIDSGVYLNCIQEGLIPTVYFVKASCDTPNPRSVDYPSTYGIQVEVGLPDNTLENRA